MKKITKLISTLFILFLLCACSINKKDLYGTWRTQYRLSQATYYVTLKLYNDDTYSIATYREENIFDIEDGSYEIKDNKLFLYEENNEYYQRALILEYKDNKLIDTNNNEFEKASDVY